MYLQVNECESTNSLLMGLAQRVDYVYADYQTAGRGQAGNGWESERGKNILLSIAVEKPEISVADQFRLSMLFPLVVVETIEETMKSEKLWKNELLAIKWPNDIYYGDKKLAGILIEHKIGTEGIAYSVLGIGLNVNQTVWQGTAPNPISLRQITEREWDREAFLERLVQRWHQALPRLQDAKQLKHEYMAHLYRRDGWYPYVERKVSTTPTMNATTNEEGQFMARIEDITRAGELILRDTDNKQRKYHFKQIRYVV